MSLPPERRHVHATPEALGAAAAHAIADQAAAAIEARGEFHLALSGGSTPRHLYRALRDLNVTWPAVYVYFSDERCVPPSDPESNYKLAWDELLSRVPVPRWQIHRMKGEYDPPLAAREYAALLPERLDLTLLGMGDDGHTASLFPGTEGLDATGRVVANFVPKLDTWRLSFTFPEINAARARIVLAAGANKAEVLRDVAAGAGKYPVERVEDADWFLDGPAAAGLEG